MTLTKRTARWLFLSLLAAAFGCSDGGQVNIGNTQTLGGKLSDYAATWDGYTQLSTFSDGSDHFHLTIDAHGHGTLLVGDSPPLPAPTDARRRLSARRRQHVQPGQLNPPFVGFAYPLHATRVQSRRIQLAIDFNDVYARWCALQTPVSTGTDADTGAEPSAARRRSRRSTIPRQPRPARSRSWTAPAEVDDCGWLTLCSLPATTCSCTATACTAALVPDGSPVGEYPLQFDGQLDATGSTLTGTLGARGGGMTVILERQNSSQLLRWAVPAAESTQATREPPPHNSRPTRGPGTATPKRGRSGRTAPIGFDLRLDGTGNGTLEVGEETLPPPTDPDVGYPAGDPSQLYRRIDGRSGIPDAFHSDRSRSRSVRRQHLRSASPAGARCKYPASSEDCDRTRTTPAATVYGCLPNVP